MTTASGTSNISALLTGMVANRGKGWVGIRQFCEILRYSKYFTSVIKKPALQMRKVRREKAPQRLPTHGIFAGLLLVTHFTRSSVMAL